MSLPAEITTYCGYECQVFVEDEKGSPAVFVSVARTNRELQSLLFDLTDENPLRPTIDKVPADLKNGVPQGQMVVFLSVYNSCWRPAAKDITEGDDGLKISFLYAKPNCSKLHYFTTENKVFPLRINAEFHNPFEDGPITYTTSPRPEQPFGRFAK